MNHDTEQWTVSKSATRHADGMVSAQHILAARAGAARIWAKAMASPTTSAQNAAIGFWLAWEMTAALDVTANSSFFLRGPRGACAHRILLGYPAR